MLAQIDILLFLDCFRNIDVFLQGLYYLQVKVSENAVPYFFDSTNGSKKFHNLYPPQILDDAYATKIFLLKYAEEVVKIQETVVFRVEIDPNAYEFNPISIQFELMFTDLKGDLSPNAVQNYLTAPPAESLFTKVGESNFTITSVLTGVNQMIYVTYLDTFSSSLDVSVHIFPTNYKFTQDYIEELFPDSADSIYEEKINTVFDRIVLPLGLCYNKLAKLLYPNDESALISLPILHHSDIEPDFIHKIINRSLFSRSIGTKIKTEVALALFQEIQELAAMVLGLKHDFIEYLKTNPGKIVHKLMKEYVTLMDDRWGENIIRESFNEKIPIYSGNKDYLINIETAQKLRTGANFEILDYFYVIDNRLFKGADENTILFETIFSKEKVNSPSISTVSSTALSKSRHLIVLVHGYLGSYIDVKMLQDTISNVYPKGLFLLSRANEGSTNGSINDMGVRLAQEIQEFLKVNSSIHIEKISFIGHSLGGLIIRAALPYLSLIKDKCYSYISLACPHLGCLNNESILVDAGMWILCKIKQSLLLNQLVLSDAEDQRHSIIYNLSKEPGLGWFKKVYFFCSSQDSYVPFHSARAEVGSSIIEGNTIEYEMASSLLSQITGSFHRVNTIFAVPSLEVSSLIGRSAHVKFLDDLQFLNILVFKYIL